MVWNSLETGGASGLAADVLRAVTMPTACAPPDFTRASQIIESAWAY